MQILRAGDCPDLQELETYLSGEETLGQLRKRGVNTRVVKKVKERRQRSPDGEETITREVELTNSGGAELERLLNQTAGSPKETHVHQVSQAQDRQDLEALSDEDLRRLSEINAKAKALPE